MANYRELFISRSLDQSHYVAVLYEEEPSCFYEALMEVVWVGGTCGGYLKYKASAISIDAVRKLAGKSEDGRAEKYTDISESNWQELLSR